MAVKVKNRKIKRYDEAYLTEPAAGESKERVKDLVLRCTEKFDELKEYAGDNPNISVPTARDVIRTINELNK